jgi:hypothetical protein
MLTMRYYMVLSTKIDLEGILGLAWWEKHIKLFLPQIFVDFMHQHHVAWKYKILYMFLIYLLYISILYENLMHIKTHPPHTILRDTRSILSFNRNLCSVSQQKYIALTDETENMLQMIVDRTLCPAGKKNRPRAYGKNRKHVGNDHR